MLTYIKKFRLILVLLILVIGVFLRSHDLYTWPRVGATFDEYAWPWLGISLIQHHIPTSWSPHPEYSHSRNIVYQKAHFRMVTPYLEHPPLFGIIAGTYAMVSGVKNMYQLDIYHIRGLALILGGFSIVMVYIFATEVYGIEVGLIASFLYAIIPTVVVGSRLVQNENFFIPFFLLTMLLVVKFIKTKKAVYRNIAALVAGLLILAKIPWTAATVAAILIFMSQKKYVDVIKFLAIVLPIFALFFVYGLYFDSKLFLSLWQLQLNRYDIAFNSIFALFTSPTLVDRQYIDGWIYLGWFAIFALLTKDIKRHFFLLFPFLAYFAIFVYGIPNEPGHGWYRYPFYPFLIIALAYSVKEYFNKNNLITFFMLLIPGLSLLQLSWAQTLGFSYTIMRVFLILCGLSLTPLYIPKTKKLTTISNFAAICFILILNYWAIMNYNEQ